MPMTIHVLAGGDVVYNLVNCIKLSERFQLERKMTECSSREKF